ncbi:uncharacterized protein [Lepeophtheirus salmonis]|uniref:uncharacterized protein n=1 Tax=Lepeophtheirus salmonis TaxID=72036 RepID=UPI001AE3C114|nr:uncharacterized protein LOC121120499 [Lepeophtheirus salmonis]
MGMLKLILFVLGLNGIKGMSSPCDKFPAVFLLDGSHFTPPSGCRIVSEQSFNPFHDIRKNMYLPRKDLLQKGNLFVYRRIQLFSEMENITFVKKLVLTKLSTCSSIRKIQELNFQVMENTPSSEPIDVLPIFIKSQACPKFYCLIDSKNSHRLSLKTSNQSIHLFSIYSFDREIMGSLSFQIVCRTKGNSTSKIKFQSTLNIRDVDDNSPIPQSELFHNHSYEVQLYNENVKKGTYFKFDEIFYDADLPNTNSYTLNFPKIDYLSNDKKLGTFDFNCGTKYIYKKENVYCQKLPSNFSGTILYLKDQKIYFLKDLRNFRSTNIMGVIMNENQEKVSNFSFKLLASSISPSPMILHTNHSYSLYVQVNDPYLTRIGTLTNFERLTLHKSNCPWFSIADNIIYLDIKGGLKEQGVHPGDTCKLELKSNSSIRINVIINVRESLSLCSNPRSRTTLACSEFSLMEECVSICGPVTSICEWSPENKTLGRSYSTCTVGTKYCPDDKCDALEQLSPNICPQDCQEPEQFRGFNILIDKINNRPIARKSGVVVSCHGKCSAVMKSQAHSMKGSNGRC